MISNKRRRIRKCVFNCKGVKSLHRFPPDEAAIKFWMEKLGLTKLPHAKSTSFVCSNHFSPSQFCIFGKKLSQTAIPDRNIPNKQDPLEPVSQTIQPPIDMPDEPKKKPIMITSASSKCFLKCKEYKGLTSFPADETSQKVWLRKLNAPERIKVNMRATRLCYNHFSPTMRPSKMVTKWAIPDINLPSQVKFVDEFKDADNEMSDSTEFDFSGSEDYKQPSPRGSTPESWKSPIQSSPEVANVQAKTGDVLRVFTLANNTTTASKNEVICPESNKYGKPKCVLKCKEFKKLFHFPKSEGRRQHWLSQIGLTHCFFESRICDRHFSAKMLPQKRLIFGAYPDRNLPETPKSRIRVASLPLQNDPAPQVTELPAYICVLTVLTDSNSAETAGKVTKYVECTSDATNPRRSRYVQVDQSIGQKVDVGISADDDFELDELEINENTTPPKLPDSDDNTKADSLGSKSKDLFECLICGEILQGHDSNAQHLSLHNKQSHLCFRCGRQFSSEVKLTSHQRKVHSDGLKKVIRCPKEHCSKAFHSNKNLHEHLKTHVGLARHMCRYCGRMFISSLKLQCHVLACRHRNAGLRRN